MKKYSKYDNTTVRIASKYGDTFTGACQWFPWEYGWSEFGVKEEGLQIGEYNRKRKSVDESDTY